MITLTSQEPIEIAIILEPEANRRGEADPDAGGVKHEPMSDAEMDPGSAAPSDGSEFEFSGSDADDFDFNDDDGTDCDGEEEVRTARKHQNESRSGEASPWSLLSPTLPVLLAALLAGRAVTPLASTAHHPRRHQAASAWTSVVPGSAQRYPC